MSASPESEPEKKPVSAKSPDAVERALDALKPVVTKLSLGGVMGYCSGMALKKVGKAMAFVVGLGFVAVQSAAYAGYIQVHWGKIADDSIVKRLDSVSWYKMCPLQCSAGHGSAVHGTLEIDLEIGQ